MKKLAPAFVAVAALGAVAFGTTAAYANGVRRAAAEPVYAAPYNWSGIYLGAHVGYEWSDADWEFLAAPGLNHRSKADGGIAGLHIGVQHQFGNAVIGIEGSITRGRNERDDDDVIGFNPAFIGDHRVRDIYTIGPRLGWSLGNWMPYITGGYASVKVEDNAVFAIGAAAGQVFWTSNERSDGWFIGGGIDWAFHSGWILGIEYRHYDVDSTFRVPVTPAGAAVFGDRHTLDLDGLDTLTVRLSYKFGREREVVPLK